MTDRLLTLNEVSDMTGISANQLRWLRQNRRGPRMGLVAGRLRAKESDVLAWVDQEIDATSMQGAS